MGLKSRLLGFLKKDTENNARQTLEEIIEETTKEEESSLENDERVLLGNVLNLRDLTADEIMIPRTEIIAAPHTISFSDLVKKFIKTGVARLPIYQGTLDNVIGFISAKAVLKNVDIKKNTSIKSLINDILFVSPAMRTLDLLLQMRESGTKMAIVVDEYGGADGLITLSDLMEEIIGDIQDAHEDEPVSFIKEVGKDMFEVDARTELRELERKLECPFPRDDDEDMNSIGGFVTSVLGRVPVRGEFVKHESGLECEILEADPRRIKKIKILSLPKLHEPVSEEKAS